MNRQMSREVSSTSSMKALLLQSAGELSVGAVPRPAPGAGEVLVEVRVAGICGSDVSRYGKIGPYTAPLIMGHEVYGTVAANGSGVTRFKRGDPGVLVPAIPCFKCPSCLNAHYSLCDNYGLFGARRDGGFAGYVTCPETNFFPVPAGMDPEKAVFVEPVATAFHALMRVGIEPGDDVAFFGSGVMGMLGAQVARVMGAGRVFLIDVNRDKLNLASKVAQAELIDASLGDPVEAINRFTGGCGVDVTVEAAGAVRTQEQALLVTRKRGRVVYLGISYLPPEMEARSFQNIARRELHVTGSWMSHSHPFPGREWEFALRVLEEDRIDVLDMITHRVGLEGAPGIFRGLYGGSIVAGKVLVYPGGLSDHERGIGRGRAQHGE